MDDKPAITEVLWENVQTLMTRRYGGPNVTRLGRESKISQGGAQRLKAGASVGVELVATVADYFGVQPWQLLAPGLGETMRLSPEELEAVRRLRDPVQPAVVRRSLSVPAQQLAEAFDAADPETRESVERRTMQELTGNPAVKKGVRQKRAESPTPAPVKGR